jgi:inorganic pyrophosphatase
MLELRQFMLDYKRLENKEVDVEQMEGPSAAQRAIRAAVALYDKEIRPKLQERDA